MLNGGPGLSLVASPGVPCVAAEWSTSILCGDENRVARGPKPRSIPRLRFATLRVRSVRSSARHSCRTFRGKVHTHDEDYLALNEHDCQNAVRAYRANQETVYPEGPT